MRRATTKTTTQRGLGWQHQQDAARLHRGHTDGTLCWWCGLPMFKTDERNWDAKKLAADHSRPRAFGGTRADRLLHGICNSQRGDGVRDHERPVVLGVHPSKWTATLALVDHPAAPSADSYAMDW